MLKFAFLLAVAVAQTPCYSYNSTECAGNSNCSWVAACSRNISGTACPTTDMTCTVQGCANQAYNTDLKTCSKCGDSCIGTAMASCNGNCQWNAYCGFAPTPLPPTPAIPCSATTQAGCVADTYGCFWAATSLNVCGAAYANPMMTSSCYACNDTMSATIRGPASRLVGQTCTWTAVAPYTKGFVLTVNSYAAGSTCPALTTMTADQDKATLTGVFSGLTFISATATVTCAKASSGSMLAPSAIVLALAAFVTRF